MSKKWQKKIETRSGGQTMTLYVNAPGTVLSEIDTIVEERSLARAKFLGHLLDLGLQAYKQKSATDARNTPAADSIPQPPRKRGVSR